MPSVERDQPARARPPGAGSPAVGDEQQPAQRLVRSSFALRVLWCAGLLVTTAALVAGRELDVDEVVQQSTAAALGVLLAIGLAVRSGGRAGSAFLVAVLVGAAAVISQWQFLLGGAAVATGVLAACLAVLGTTPASGFGRAVVEVVVAEVLATAGALAVAGFGADLDPQRFRYTVLALAMGAAVALVYRLGGGLHALGRRGVLLVVAALVLLVVGLAYTAALTHWGSPGLRHDVEATKDWLRDRLGAVPHPVEALPGVPALLWGVTMRERRRQGWWLCAFGTTATATTATRLVEGGSTLLHAALATAYGVVLGLAIGYVVVRALLLARGRPGRRAARTEPASSRPEPPRLRPLH